MHACGFRTSVFLLACASVLASCASPRAYIQFHTQDPRIRAAVLSAAEAWHAATPKAAPIEAWPAGRGNPGPRTPIIHIGFRAVAPAAATAPALQSLAGDFGQKQGLATGFALESWARDAKGEWSCIPLLWDVWGVASAAGKAPRPGAALEWSSVGTMPGIAGKLVAAGSSPSGGQALVACLAAQGGFAAELLSLQSGDKGYAAAGARTLFSSWAKAGTSPLFFPDSLRFTVSDMESVENGPGGASLALFESYQQAFSPKVSSSAASSSRSFTTLTAALGNGRYALVGTILAGWLTGPRDRLVSGESFLAYLVQPETQKAISIATRLMPANFQAPVLEGTNAAILRLALRADTILGVNPEPADEPAVKKLDDALAAMRNDPGNWASHIP